MNKKDIGQAGEEYTLQCLIANEFDILDRNVRIGRGELDIVAQRDGDLHVFEVKTIVKKEIDTIRPEENIHQRKQSQLRKLTGQYVARSGFSWRNIRIHASCVYVSSMGTFINLYFIKDLIIER